MQRATALPMVLAVVPAAAGSSNPLGKVNELLDSLNAKIKRDAANEAKAFKEYFEWCDDAAKEGAFSLKTAQKEKDELEAEIQKQTSVAADADTKVGQLAASIAEDSAQLKDATALRQQEAEDFSAAESELLSVVDTLSRAIGIVERQMAKNPSALAQVDTSNLDNLLKSLSTVVDAASLSGSDKQTLLALVQSQHAADDDSSSMDAPAASVYRSSSGGVVDVLEDLKEKAEEQLSALRKSEGNAAHNFNMLKASLEDQISADTKGKDAASSAKSGAEEKKAVAEGELAKVAKLLDNGAAALKSTQASCMQAASDHETTVASRKEELDVLAKAKEVLASSTGGAAGRVYSMLQASERSHLRSHADLARHEVIALVKQLAKQQHSAVLSQLASRIAAVMQYGGSAGEDPFTKVKEMISGLISKLESESSGDASEKAWCDEQLSKTQVKKNELGEDVDKLTNKIDQASAESATLKADVATLLSELASLAKSQAEMDKIRAESHAEYVEAKADLEEGITGVRNAIGVLRDYYGGSAAAFVQEGEGGASTQPSPPEQHTTSSGAGSSIIEILEVVESDFAKNLAAVETEESDAESEYQATTQDNSVTKTLKTQDAKYKDQEVKALTKRLSELAGDRDSKDAELSSVLDYYEKVKGRCTAKAETYEDRKARRDAEIAGLKQALEVLENEAAFTQRQKRGLRGGSLSM